MNGNNSLYGREYKSDMPPEMPAYSDRVPAMPFTPARGGMCAQAQGAMITPMSSYALTTMQGETMPQDMAQQSAMTQSGASRAMPAAQDMSYLSGYLSQNIGKSVLAEFVVGTNSFLDKSGVLRSVGANYFVLEDFFSHALTVCDLYSVKFVTVNN
jgi:hypothetical protein